MHSLVRWGKRSRLPTSYLDIRIIEDTCGQGWKGVGQRDVQFVECRTCAFASYLDHMAESGSRLEQPVSSGRVLSRFRGSLRAEPPSFFWPWRFDPGSGVFFESDFVVTRLTRGTRVLSGDSGCLLHEDGRDLVWILGEVPWSRFTLLY